MYGTYLAQRGPRPLKKPFVPSLDLIRLNAGTVEVGKLPGLLVYILTLSASHGQRKQSAMTSALPEAIDHPILLYLLANSSPTTPL